MPKIYVNIYAKAIHTPLPGCQHEKNILSWIRKARAPGATNGEWDTSCSTLPEAMAKYPGFRLCQMPPCVKGRAKEPKIKIGADEMILWLRKNDKAKSWNNKDLGKKLKEIVDKLDRKCITEEDVPAFWANHDGDKNIGEMNLPKTAAQYTIPISQIPALYEQLNALT